MGLNPFNFIPLDPVEVVYEEITRLHTGLKAGKQFVSLYDGTLLPRLTESDDPRRYVKIGDMILRCYGLAKFHELTGN